MNLVEFYERKAFGHHDKHAINPEHVASLEATNYNQETLVHLKGGTTLLISERLENVKNKLLEAADRDSGRDDG